MLVELDGVRLLTDPLLRTRLLHLRRADKVDAADLRRIDAVLISHLHFDHLDLPSLRRLGRDVPLVVPRGVGNFVARKGFTRVSELGVGEELHIGPLAVRGTHAVHAPGRLPVGLRASPMGHLICGSRSVYFAGDTDVFEAMAELGPLDVALVPIWGWGKSLGPGHMDPRAAAEAVRLLRASIAIPIHWGTYFPLQSGLRGVPAFARAPVEDFQARLADVAPRTELRVLHPGEETTI